MFSYILIGFVFVSLSKSQYFRKDYEYNRKTNAFYKLHIETKSNLVAQNECKAEGAELMLPTSNLDIAQAQCMLKKYPDIGESVWVSEENMLHEPVETIPDLSFNQTHIEQKLLICNMVTRSRELRVDNCSSERPFICKIEAKKTDFYKLCNDTSTNLTLCHSPRIAKVYRSDYEYNQKTDAFYKLHLENVQYGEAKYKCIVEGAQLMLPTSHFDVAQLQAMYEKYPELFANQVWTNLDGETRSAEENPNKRTDNSEDNRHGEMTDYSDIAVSSLHSPMICESISRQAEILKTLCDIERPFICKVEAKDAPYDSICDVYGSNYRYFASIGSCYSVPIMAFTWIEAYKECQAQGAHLVVINSESERAVVKYFMSKTVDYIPRARSLSYFIAGFRARKPSRTFITIFNQTLEEAGFSEWSYGQPSNQGGDEYCGSLYKMDGKLNDLNCNHTYPFICEKETKYEIR